MSPQDLCYHLRAVAAYIDNSPEPAVHKVVEGLQTALKMMPGNKTAGTVDRFVDKDYAAAMHGLDTLIERLSKASKTLNPQDEAKLQLDRSIADFQSMKATLAEQFSNLGDIDI